MDDTCCILAFFHNVFVLFRSRRNLRQQKNHGGPSSEASETHWRASGTNWEQTRTWWDVQSSGWWASECNPVLTQRQLDWTQTLSAHRNWMCGLWPHSRSCSYRPQLVTVQFREDTWSEGISRTSASRTWLLSPSLSARPSKVIANRKAHERNMKW